MRQQFLLFFFRLISAWTFADYDKYLDSTRDGVSFHYFNCIFPTLKSPLPLRLALDAAMTKVPKAKKVKEKAEAEQDLDLARAR